MTDPIRAALITGSIQLTTGLLTLTVALLALNSWRRNALGARQITLAEECLQAVWKLDADIKAARFLLVPGSIEEIKNSFNPKIKENYIKNHREASLAMRACMENLRALNNKLMLAEIYLGDLPRTQIPDVKRFFHTMPYSLYQEYDEVIPSFLVCLMYTSPETIEQTEISPKAIEEFDNYAEMFYGFTYEYEEDEYTVRLRASKVAFERHIKKVLKRQGLFDRLLERASHLAMDRYQSRFKPVKVNRMPMRKWIANRNNEAKE